MGSRWQAQPSSPSWQYRGREQRPSWKLPLCHGYFWLGPAAGIGREGLVASGGFADAGRDDAGLYRDHLDDKRGECDAPGIEEGV
jgi:hypothetical protein